MWIGESRKEKNYGKARRYTKGKLHFSSIVFPIINKNNNFPLHISLDDRNQTTGVVLREHVKSLDVNVMTYPVVEQLPKDILDKIINSVFTKIE